MSGVYIPGMEMPTSCFECALLDYSDTYKCRFGFKSLTPEHGINISRPPFCPLIPVPDHGRLIDADAMTESVKTQTGFVKLLGGREMVEIAGIIERNFLKEVNNAPTIIPAEEGTE